MRVRFSLGLCALIHHLRRIVRNRFPRRPLSWPWLPLCGRECPLRLNHGTGNGVAEFCLHAPISPAVSARTLSPRAEILREAICLQEQRWRRPVFDLDARLSSPPSRRAFAPRLDTSGAGLFAPIIFLLHSRSPLSSTDVSGTSLSNTLDCL
jgi:hypothetical protein